MKAASRRKAAWPRWVSREWVGQWVLVREWMGGLVVGECVVTEMVGSWADGWVVGWLSERIGRWMSG